MNNCGSLLATGLSACNSRIQQINAVQLDTKGTVYTSAELDTIAKTKTVLSASAGITGIFLPLSGFNITTDEPNVTTSTSGTKDVFDDQVPSAIAFLDRSFHDYRHMWSSNRSIVDVTLFTKDGFRVMTQTSDGKYKGFRAKMYAPPGLPKTDNPSEAHPVYLLFTDLEEFKNMVVMAMPFTKTEIEDLVPVGVDLRIVTAYTAGDVVVKGVLRGGDTGKTGLTTWTVKDANASDVAVTADVDDGGGQYTLTIQKDAGGTPANLASGEWAEIQGTIVATSYVTYITNVLKVNA